MEQRTGKLADRLRWGWTAVVAILLLAGGCSMTSVPIKVPTKKTAEVISAQDHNDTVTMGAPYLYLEKPDVDWGKAREDAIKYCQEWRGFNHAEPVGNTRRQCTSQVGSDCVRYALVGDYKCLP